MAPSLTDWARCAVECKSFATCSDVDNAGPWSHRFHWPSKSQPSVDSLSLASCEFWQFDELLLRTIRPVPIRRSRGFTFRPVSRPMDINMFAVEVFQRGDSESSFATSKKRRSVSRTSRLTLGPSRGLKLFRGSSAWF